MTGLGARLRVSALGHYADALEISRPAEAARLTEVTCEQSLKSRDLGNWLPSSCGQRYDGHRCSLRGGHSNSHVCTCRGVRWQHSTPPPLTETRCPGDHRGIVAKTSHWCREVHPDGHQCTWARWKHGSAGKVEESEHKCRACGFRWPA